jgi:DNA repair exonuclease SbcCD nuclease subunit
MLFRFIHAADIHLDSPLRGLERYPGTPVDAIRQATRRALENLVELAIEQSVAFVLIAGDLYDGDWKDFHTGLFFVGQMARLREAGIPVLLIAGNHDAANRMSRRLPLPENVRVLSPGRPESVILDECETAIHGQGFAQAAVLDNLARAYPSAVPGLFNIGLLHTAAEGRAGHEPYAPCTLDDLRAKGYDYWALGHVHRQETLATDPPVVFPGNLQGRHMRETGPKGCMMVTVDDRQRPRAEPCWLDVFRWELCPIDASGVATGDDLLEAVRRGLEALAAKADSRPLAVRVEVRGPCPAHRALWAEPQRWTNEVRAVAQDVPGSQVWIEKVLLPADPGAAPGVPASRDDALDELAACVADWKADPAKLASLAEALGALRAKLPRDLLEGPDAVGLDVPQRIRRWLDEAEQMLARELRAGETGR